MDMPVLPTLIPPSWTSSNDAFDDTMTSLFRCVSQQAGDCRERMLVDIGITSGNGSHGDLVTKLSCCSSGSATYKPYLLWLHD
ncbi:uncharacterized [Tachysurus ichikawai]